MKCLWVDCATEAAEVGIQRIREQTSAAGNVRRIPCRCSHYASSAVASWKALLPAETVNTTCLLIIQTVCLNLVISHPSYHFLLYCSCFCKQLVYLELLNYSTLGMLSRQAYEIEIFVSCLLSLTTAGFLLQT